MRKTADLQYASLEGQEFLPTVRSAIRRDEVDLENCSHALKEPSADIRVRRRIPTALCHALNVFGHALTKLLYEGLVTKRKTMLHRQAGEALAQHYGRRAPQIAAQLALHFERGREFERAVEFLMHAGDNATALYANAEAAEHYTRALSLAAKLPEELQAETKVTIYAKRGATNMALSDFEHRLMTTKDLKHHQGVLTPEKLAMGSPRWPQHSSCYRLDEWKLGRRMR